ncbi:MAG: PepSY domain-containing protein [Pseudomonadota bacterium]|nr:PepSY domain-containing protein [Pseudomonadota bacterium]
MKIHTGWLRWIHKWIGLLIGLQLLLWTLSGTMMALLDMEKVAGGPRAEAPQVLIGTADAWPAIRRQLGAEPVLGLSVRPLLDRPIYELNTPKGIRLFDARTGRPIVIDAVAARKVAEAGYAGRGQVQRITLLDRLPLAVREHQLPIWQVDFADDNNSSFYVSASTGALLERRNDTWRLWDFFWMLHNMDYANRTSFNHPLIIVLGFTAVWLAITGFYLLFRTGWRSDFKHKRLRPPPAS